MRSGPEWTSAHIRCAGLGNRGPGPDDLLGNLNRLIRARRTIRWDALPLAWAAVAFVLVNNFWWALFLGVTGIEKPSNAGTFLLSLSMQVLLYLICAAALPYGRTARGLDLREAYLAESRYFFILVVIYVLMTQVLVLFAGGPGSSGTRRPCCATCSWPPACR